MKKFLLWIWQFPQNLIGFILTRNPVSYVDYNCNDGETVRIYFVKNLFKSGVSLGNYIVLDECYMHTALFFTSNHEHGHQKQSRILGWFYLLIIGLPSACGNLLNRVFNFDYYAQPWEKWANKLGGIK